MKLHLITTALLISLQLYGFDTQASGRFGCLKRKHQRGSSQEMDSPRRQLPDSQVREIPQALFRQLVQDEIRKNAAAITVAQCQAAIDMVKPEQTPTQPIVPMVDPCPFAPLCIGCVVLGHPTTSNPTWKEYARVGCFIATLASFKYWMECGR